MAYNDVIKHWFEGADEAWETANDLIVSKKYHFALFFLHLSIEKTLKGLYLEKFNEPPPYVHNLIRLAKDLDVSLTEDEIKEMEEISSFNIAARYDDYKFQLYKRATKEFTNDWMEIGAKLREKFLEKKGK
ncbi:MAG: HEPN domain-containing protein [Patescibacteria group bacterium]